MTALLLIAGLVLLLVGAEALVRGASRLAAATGLSQLVIGLTVVAFGTSAPELAVGLDAAWRGSVDVAIGNVVGSNITNVLLILGLSALVAPLVVSRQLVRLDVPVMIACSLAVLALAWNGRIGRVEGIVLALAAVAYVILQIRASRRAGEDAPVPAPDAGATAVRGPRGWIGNGLLVLGGLALLVLGARWMVGAAVTVAEALGLSELVIGLTVIAVGTSLPEIATSLLATLRGQRDLAVGNVVGSNILNLLAVLGLTAAFAPDGLPVGRATVHFDLPVMIATAVACLPIFFTGHCIRRWEGALFLGYYVVYVAYLLLQATQHDALPAFSGTMLYFVLPLTAVTLAVTLSRSLRHRFRAR
ncbi:calcium/sodium antiporter [Coralloluteibacterium stylophorae]|uniref:Calcium/sodium antiporter n=1 Tax=Coralloluteibacterium stylophorae TaxID=1776034 RepID=A0AAP2CEU4_9GAMM|nr:calcium/sodium antiporter [Coralloluteibacterium stylophorae]MBS7458470.1 calcium/sodium antiporter [Coralloluteibacterium stylophorae]